MRDENRLNRDEDPDHQHAGPEPLVQFKNLLGQPELFFTARRRAELHMQGVEDGKTEQQRVRQDENQDHGRDAQLIAGLNQDLAPAESGPFLCDRCLPMLSSSAGVTLLSNDAVPDGFP
jgi:hypothetical protein